MTIPTTWISMEIPTKLSQDNSNLRQGIEPHLLLTALDDSSHQPELRISYTQIGRY